MREVVTGRPAPMRGRTGQGPRRTVAALLFLLLPVLAVAACSSGSSTSPPTPGGSAPLAPGAGGSVTPPASGVLVGAWVRKANGQQLPEAVAEFEKGVGRRLDIVQNYYPWETPFPTDIDTETLAAGGIPLISWNGTDSTRITSGSADALIVQRAKAVAALGKPVFLRWFWEPDNKKKLATAGSPEDYIAAWKHIRTVFREQGATNAAFVWCPTSIGFSMDRAQPFYPGDDEVDWLCADGYGSAGGRSFRQVFASFYKWAAPHGKPIILGEFGVSGDDAGSAKWLRDGFATLTKDMPSVRAVVYFDADVNSLRNRPQSLAALRGLLRQPEFDPLHRPPVS